MIRHVALSLVVVASLLQVSPAGLTKASPPGSVGPVSAKMSVPATLGDVPGTTSDWLAVVEEDIRDSEYNITWQKDTYLVDVEAAYQAPNRAHNLRTYFTPQGIRVIPRVFEGDEPPWAWGLTLSGYGYADRVLPVAAVTPQGAANRIEYERDLLTEWYVNDEHGLEQGFTLRAHPESTNADQPSVVVLDLALGGNLKPQMSADGAAVEFITLGGVRVLRYSDLHAYDATGRSLAADMRIIAGDAQSAEPLASHGPEWTVRIVVDDGDAVYPITVDPRGTGYDWAFQSDQEGAWLGISVATAGDVNGDGYSDVIVGANQYDNGQTNEGRIYVFHGSATGLSGAANWWTESNQANADFGHSVGTAGDINGDGYSDIIVGAPEYDNGQMDEGRIYVYHGSAAGLSGLNTWTAECNQANARFGQSVGTAGDVNGDGYSDVIVGAHWYDNGQSSEGRAYVYHGSGTGLCASPAWTAESNQAGAWFGFSVGTAGDVNGDGHSDVIVGARYYSGGESYEGRAYVYSGSATGLVTTPAWTAESNQAGARFGESAGTAGDVNGDGYSDVIVGAPYYDNGQDNEGRAYVYHGSATGLAGTSAWTAESDQEDAWLGESVAAAGDVNGDGYCDIIVGAPAYDNGEDNEGRAYIYNGSPLGLATTHDWTIEGGQEGADLGNSVATAGDVNGDGLSDVIVGARLYDGGQTDEGRAYVFHGAATGLSTTHAWIAESNQTSALFSRSVGTAGDVNGDGYSDVIVGAPYYDNGQDNEGRAYIYHGSALGLSTMPNRWLEGNQAHAHFGKSVGTAGDVNGDGYSDVIVGAPEHDNEEMEEGRAYIYHGSATGLSSTANWVAESDRADALFGYSVGTAGDVNGDGYSDVIVGAPGYYDEETAGGRAYVYHGSASGLSAAANWTAESDRDGADFACSVGTAGDINGDGYSDIIIGASRHQNGQTYEGRAFVYHGSRAGLVTTAGWTAESNQANADFGYSVGTAGDVNGDGYSDVIVGARWYDGGQTNEGRAYVYHGSLTGLSTAAEWTAESDQEGAHFGSSAASAGDVNGDGYSDVIVGARYYDNGQADEGRAYVYHGSDTGLYTGAAWNAESDQEGATFGHSVGAAGDVNGDGYGDVIIGAPSHDLGQVDEGRAFVYYGNGGDGVQLLPRQMRSDGLSPIAYLGRSDSETAFQVRLIGRMPLGREDVRLQWQVAPLGVAFTGPGVISGISGWQEALPGGTLMSQAVGGLEPGMAYHWRVRLLYRPGNALGLQASRWVHMSWSGWSETDLRTAKVYLLCLPLVLRSY